MIGWQASILGTLYAVIMGFMLYTVWTNFQAAKINAEIEANSLMNVYRLARGLPPAGRDAIQKLARDYAFDMVSNEWPDMRHGEISPTGLQITEELWKTTLAIDARSPGEQTALDHTIGALSDMTEHRRIRQLQSKSRLPGILWAVLILGGMLTVGSSCLFGIDNFKIQFLLVVALAFMTSLALVAIADLDRPFRGSVHVSSAGFELATQTMNGPSPSSK